MKDKNTALNSHLPDRGTAIHSRLQRMTLSQQDKPAKRHKHAVDREIERSEI
jgi:hypothetical protein